MYDPNDLSRTIREVAVTLKEKMMVKLPNLKIPDYVKDKYTFTLNFYPPKFSPLPTNKMALTFVPPFLRWFICGKDIKVLKNESLKPAKQVTVTKHDIYNFKGHLHVNINNVRVETPIHEGEESKRVSSKSI